MAFVSGASSRREKDFSGNASTLREEAKSGWKCVQYCWMLASDSLLVIMNGYGLAQTGGGSGRVVVWYDRVNMDKLDERKNKFVVRWGYFKRG